MSAFPEEALTRDAFLGGRLRLWQPRVGYRAAIDPILLDLWAETLIATRGARILRLKGLIWATGFETPFVLHGVQHLLDPLVRLKRWTGGDRRSRVVLIARDVPPEALRDSLDLLRLRPGAGA
ncbi:hypothetical protein CNY89_13930 [Amaricoccus sp. HAR-UPW-R2A-40]|nr:hypothetical protein CNY89_13930 [Amaricoccus sp. HAR-UPW-R2A-40]